MKTITTILFGLWCVWSFAQGIEDFSNSTTTGSYSDGSFVGNNTITWSYVASRNGNGDANNSGINLPALMLRQSSENSKISSSSISGGIANFSVKLYKGFTSDGGRQVELFINGVSKGTSTPFDNFDEQTFTVENINVSGNFTIEIVNSTSKQVIIDDITWTGFSGTGSPSLVVGSGVSGLSYFEGNFDATTAEGAFTVQGLNLTEDTVVTAPADFEVSLTSGGSFSNSVTIPENSGTIAETDIYIRLASGLSTGNYSGSATVSSSGLSESVNVAGEVQAATPQLSISTTSIAGINYSVNDGPSQEESFSVEGQFLTNDIVVTAPLSYEVSLSSGNGFASGVNISTSSGSVSSTTVYVRLAAGLAENTYTEDVEVSTAGATTQNVTLDGTVYGEVTRDMLISGVFDGPLSGGTPKVIELYVIKDIADLSTYGFGNANNGNGSNGQQFTFPEVSASAGDYIYISSEVPNFETYFGFEPDYTSGAVNINGDDAIELFQNGQIIDTFGEIEYDNADDQDWLFTDGWAYRKDNTGPDGKNFTSSNWTFSGVNVNANQTDNSSATSPFPIRTFETTMDVNSFNAANLKLYPNPVSNGVLSIETSSSVASEVELFNMLGQMVLATKASKHINVSSLTAGIYLVRVKEGTTSKTKKIIIK